jgi:acyl transferase domain-containing protein/acyl carrier protein
MTPDEIADLLRQKLEEELGTELTAADNERDFIQLGVDSVIASELIRFVQGELNPNLTVAAVYDHPAIGKLARHLCEPQWPRVLGDAVGAKINSDELSSRVSGLSGRTNLGEIAPARTLSRGYSPIAVIGASGRFPGAATLADLWKNLSRGRCSIRKVPAERARYWDMTGLGLRARRTRRWGGFLTEIESFDASFFGIPPAEASMMDPQQRLFLEEAWKAIEDAGYATGALSKLRCGVYAGIMNTDYQELLTLANRGHPKVHELTGTSASIFAARIAYHLNLHGPAMALDTACSSSLVALHLACRQLQLDEIDIAIVGAATLYLTENRYYLMDQAGMLSKAGRCSPFDESADGVVPAEGIGVLVLKKLEDAQRDRDAIYGSIISSGVNQDGKTDGITSPSMQAQLELLRETYLRGDVDPGTIQYIEAHGTGTALGDPIEFEALRQFFLNRDTSSGGASAERRSYRLGSVKANLGHTTAAAGVAALLKILLSLKHGALPPQIHFDAPNRHIPYSASPFRINTTLEEWRRDGAYPRRAALSSFGFSGTNAHAILEEAPPGQPHTLVAGDTDFWILLSAKSTEGLVRRAAELKRWIESQVRNVSVLDLSFTLATGRAALEERLAFLARDIGQVCEGLKQFLGSRSNTKINLYRGSASRDAARSEPTTLGAGWVSGMSVDWEDAYSGLAPRRLHLPAYSFERTRYWYDTPDPQESAYESDLVASSLLPSRFEELGSGEIVYTYDICCEQAPWLAEHRVFDHRLVPAALYISMVLATGAVPYRLSDVVISRPLVLNGKQPTQPLQLVLRPNVDSRGQRSFEIYSKQLTGKISRWTLHAKGVSEPLRREPERLDQNGLGELRKALSEQSAESYYDSLGANFTLGSGFRGLHSLSVGEGEALGEVRLPIEAGPRSEPIHPVVLDACMQLLNAVRTRFVPGAVYVPFECEAVELWRSVPECFYCYGQVRKNGTAEGVVLGDIWLIDAEEQVLGRVTGLLLKEANERRMFGDRPEERINEWLYEVVWQEQARTLEKRNETDAGWWLIAADQNGIAEQLVERLRYQGQECVLVRRANGDVPDVIRKDFQLVSGDTTEWKRFLLEHNGNKRPLMGAVHLCSLDAKDSVETTETTLDPDTRHGCGSALALIQSLLRFQITPQTGVWLVTRGAQVILHGEPCASIAQSPLWGLGKVVALEYPDIHCRRVDLENNPASDSLQLDGLVAELLQPAKEDQIAWRQGRRYVARLQHFDQSESLPKVPGNRLRLATRGVYLITGGLSGLGLQVAEWLIDNGIRELILNGRRSPSSAVQQRLQRLRKKGAEVEVILADVSRAADVQGLLRRTERNQRRLSGVFHSVGVLRDGMLLNQDWDAFEQVLAPKMLGAWHLHRFTLERGLQIFVLFSSIASVLGSLGQSNYAAANMFLDMLAHHRRALGLPALSINWGGWSKIGAAARRRQQLQALESHVGLGWIEPKQGLTALELVLSQTRPQIMVAPVNWTLFRQSQPDPFLSAVGMSAKDVRAEQPEIVERSMILQQLESLPAKRKIGALIDYLQHELANALQLPELPEITHRFRELGVDSLMAVEFRNHLQREFQGITYISSTALLEYPNITELANYLLSQLERPPKQKKTDTSVRSLRSADHESEGFMARLESLSDQEIERLLIQKFT